MTHRARLPSSIGAVAEAVTAARGQADRLARVFDRSPVPMVMVDDERRYVEGNRPARLVFRLSLPELRRRRIDDLTPPNRWPVLEATWTQLRETGYAAGSYEVRGPDGGRLEVVFYGLADALPGFHVGVFAPAGWSDAELGLFNSGGLELSAALTPREVEVLQLAARGRAGPRIADELMLSPTTVRSHFENIYAKLDVTGRAAAVATAMRLGLIE